LERLAHRLKGGDATAFRARQELSLNVHLRVIYKMKYALMMVDHILDLSGGQIEDFEFEATLLHEGATFIAKYKNTYGDLHRRRQPKVETVRWVTGMTPLKEVRTEYIAYGNEADLG
jgi:hypothetical protein